MPIFLIPVYIYLCCSLSSPLLRPALCHFPLSLLGIPVRPVESISGVDIHVFFLSTTPLPSLFAFHFKPSISPCTSNRILAAIGAGPPHPSTETQTKTLRGRRQLSDINYRPPSTIHRPLSASSLSCPSSHRRHAMSMASLAPSAATSGTRLQIPGASPPGPVRPKFNSHVTSDRLREGAGLYLPPLFKAPSSNIRKGRVSVFKELGLDDLTVCRVPIDDKYLSGNNSSTTVYSTHTPLRR